MSIATDLLKAEHVGIRDIKEHLSSKEKPKHFKNVKELIKDLEND